MYQIKQLPEDFAVKEISGVKIGKEGRYLYFRLKKKNWTTLGAVKKLAEILGVKEKQIGFAGSKDKKAITEQICSILGATEKKLLKLKIEGMVLEPLGRGDVPVSLGDLLRNHFEIVIRNLGRFSVDKIKFIPGYFDEQRFGSNNVKIGRHLVKKEFREALELINHPESNQHWQQKPNDLVGALKKLPLRLLRLYLNAYQSFLWNETLAEYLERKGKVKKMSGYSQGKFIFVEDEEKFSKLKIPLIGFGSSENGMEPAVKQIIIPLMEKENLHYDDFIIRPIPELTLEGELREAFVKVNQLKVSQPEADELNPGKKKVKLTFTLPKGSYATVAVRGIINEQDI